MDNSSTDEYNADEYYRILQVRDGRPTTLFHGVNRSRTLPLDEWIEAEVEEVFDGSGGTTYQSGFHVLPSFGGAVDYLRQFSKERPLVVSRVYAQDLWPKSHSPTNVQLARYMKIDPSQWIAAHNPIDSPCPISSVRASQMLEVAESADSDVLDETLRAGSRVG